MKRPDNIFLITADSLRFDTVFGHGDTRLNYMKKNGTCFTQARSAGCWTLPATASVFTGLMPHQHGATSQTRYLSPKIPTLAERLKGLGYETVMLTANRVTTDIFGLDRGFDRVIRSWERVTPKNSKLKRLLVMAGKPRVRKMLLSKDRLVQELSGELEAGNAWAQVNYPEMFDETLNILKENRRKKKPAFFYINLMETHFPYHVAPTFRLISSGWKKRLEEILGLYHLLNQSFLKDNRDYFPGDISEIFRKRQRLAWEQIVSSLDQFVQDLHEDKNNLVIFCSDHGDNFGDQGWYYHFSNVTEAGNRVPLFWLDNRSRRATQMDEPVSSRFIHHSILDACGKSSSEGTLFSPSPETLPVMQSYWYNNQGRTMRQYRANQFCFVQNDVRYLFRQGKWYVAPLLYNGGELMAQYMGSGTDPIKESVEDRQRRDFLLKTFDRYLDFSLKINASTIH